MKVGQLNARVAEAMVVPDDHVFVTIRNLREAGQLTSLGKRGRGSPDQTYTDAARLLIAHILEENPGRRSPRHVATFGALRWWDRGAPSEDQPFSFAGLLPGVSIETFEEALAALVQIFAERLEHPAYLDECSWGFDGSILQKPQCRVEIAPRDLAAVIRMGRATYCFGEPVHDLRAPVDQVDERFRLGRQSLCFINQEVIARVADGFREKGDRNA